jgi:hypothetical protein
MIDGLWTSLDFQANTTSQSIFGSRKTDLIAISIALDEAHAAPAGEALDRLIVVARACNDWINNHPNTAATPSVGKKTSNRRKGIEALLGQIRTVREELDPLLIDNPLWRQNITSRYETSTKDLNIEPTGKDPRVMKERAAFHHELLERTILRARVLGHKKDDLNPEQIGFIVAKATLKIDNVLDKKKRAACRTEALRVLCAMLGKNRQLAILFESTGVEVVVVPADRPMTDLPEFASLRDQEIEQQSGTARTWDPTRGVGGLHIGSKIYVAVTEENLLGTAVGPSVAAIGGGCYAAHYSTTSHEFAHGIHMSAAMSTPQKDTIIQCFKNRKKVIIDNDKGILYLDDFSFNPSQYELNTHFSREWVDGPRQKKFALMAPRHYLVARGSAYVMAPDGSNFLYASNYELQDCYAAFDEREYFAQCVNAYLGANGGSDPYTARPRHNGEAWVRSNEDPAMVQLLDELFSAGTTNAYAKAQIEDTNVDDGVDVLTLADHLRAPGRSHRS